MILGMITQHFISFSHSIDLSLAAAKMRLLQLDVEINQILSDPNAILKPSTSVLPAVASSVFVPSSFSSIMAAGNVAAVALPGKPGIPGALISDKAPLSSKNSRGAALSKVSTGKASTAAGQSVSGNYTWSQKTVSSQGSVAQPVSSSESVELFAGTGALSKKKAQASAAAAAAVKQMEQFCSVRM